MLPLKTNFIYFPSVCLPLGFVVVFFLIPLSTSRNFLCFVVEGMCFLLLIKSAVWVESKICYWCWEGMIRMEFSTNESYFISLHGMAFSCLLRRVAFNRFLVVYFDWNEKVGKFWIWSEYDCGKNLFFYGRNFRDNLTGW